MITSRPLGKETKVLENTGQHIRPNSQTETVNSCPLGKQRKHLSLRLLKGIIREKLKTHKIRLTFNTTTMKQEIVIEHVDYNAFVTRSKKLSTQSKNSGKSSLSVQSRSTNTLTQLSKFDEIYQRQISDTPIFNCSSCERTFLKRGICLLQQGNQTRRNKIRKLSTSFEDVKSHVQDGYICKHCKK